MGRMGGMGRMGRMAASHGSDKGLVTGLPQVTYNSTTKDEQFSSELHKELEQTFPQRECTNSQPAHKG